MIDLHGLTAEAQALTRRIGEMHRNAIGPHRIRLARLWRRAWERAHRRMVREVAALSAR